jgi:FlaA1/EpsC-like NDP-sugar epimerase
MKKSELIFAALLVPVDFLMIVIAAILAYFIRFTGTIVEIRPILFDLPFKQYLILLAIVIPFFLLIFALLGLYNIKKRRLIDDLYGAIVGISTGVVGITMYIFLRAENFSSRFLVIASWLLAIFCVVMGRFIIRFLQRRLYSLGYGVHRVVLVGSTKAAKNIIATFATKLSGNEIVGIIEEINGGTLSKLDELSQSKGIDEIIQTDPNLPKEKFLDVVDFADERKIDIKYIPDLFGTQATNIEVRAVAGIPVVELKRTPLDGWGKIIKRIIDVLGSVFGLVILLPLFILVAIIIKID